MASTGDSIQIFRHRDYLRWEYEWIKADDFRRAGKHVTEPMLPVTEVGFFGRRDSAAPVDDNPDSPSWNVSRQASYLFSHAREGRTRWDDRNLRAEHLPIFKPICNIFSSALFRVPPVRKLNESIDVGEPWKDYLEDVDLLGTDMNAYSFAATKLTMAFGRCYSLTDLPSPTRKPDTLADQIAMKLRAYSYLLTPLQVVNWSMDVFGNFRWIVVMEAAAEVHGPAQEIDPPLAIRYRIWYPDRWELYKPGTGKTGKPVAGAWVLEASEPTGLSRIPVEPYYADKTDMRSGGSSDSPLASVLGVDVAVFNLLSQLDETELQSVFGQLTMEGDAPIAADVGESYILMYPPGAQQPDYISVDNAVPQGKWERIVARIHAAAQQSLTGRSGKSADSKEERSPGALNVEFQDRYSMLTTIAAGAEDFEEGNFRNFAAWHKLPGPAPTTTYPRRFDLRSIGQQINDALKFNELPAGLKAKVAMLEQTVDRVLKETGVDDTTRVEATAGVREAVDRVMKAAEANNVAAEKPTGVDVDRPQAPGPQPGAVQ